MGTACCNFIVCHLEEVCVCVSSLTHYLHLFFSHIVVWEHNMWSCAWERLIIQRVVLTSDGLAIADASLLWFNVTYSSVFFPSSFSSLCAEKPSDDWHVKTRPTQYGIVVCLGIFCSSIKGFTGYFGWVKFCFLWYLLFLMIMIFYIYI